MSTLRPSAIAARVPPGFCAIAARQAARIDGTSGHALASAHTRLCAYARDRPMTRWNLVIPERTDRAVRTYLARTGGKKGDLSRFVDEAVRRRVLDLTVREIKDRNARYDQQEILDLIDEEAAAARADRP